MFSIKNVDCDPEQIFFSGELSDCGCFYLFRSGITFL